MTLPDPQRARWLLVCALAAAPVAGMIWLADVGQLGLPMLDHWVFLWFYDRVLSGAATLHDLFAPHNRIHITASLRIVLGSLAWLSGWSLQWEAIAGMALVAATTGSLLRLGGASRHRAPSGWEAVAFVLTPLLLWSPVLYFAFAWTVGFVHFFTNACVVFAVHALRRGPAGALPSRPRYALALGLCVVASFARVEGLFAWIALAPLALRAAPAAPGRVAAERALVWAGAAGLCWGGWWLAVALPPEGLAVGGAAPGLPALGRPLLFLPHLLGLAGFPVGAFLERLAPSWPTTVVAWPAGVLVVAGFAASGWGTLRRGSPALRERAWPWIALGGYGLAFAGAIALGRLVDPASGWAFDVYYSMYSTTFALLSIAALRLLLLAAPLARREATSHRVVPAGAVAHAAVGLLAAGALASALAVLPQRLLTRERSRGTAPCVELVHYLAPASNCSVGPGSTVAIERLERSGLRTLRHDLVFDGASRVEGAVAGLEELAPGTWRLHGWAGRLADGTLPETVVLTRAGGSDAIVLVAGARRRGEGRVVWSVVLPGRAKRSWRDPGELRAWAYDRANARFVPVGSAEEEGRRGSPAALR